MSKQSKMARRRDPAGEKSSYLALRVADAFDRQAKKIVEQTAEAGERPDGATLDALTLQAEPRRHPPPRISQLPHHSTSLIRSASSPTGLRGW